MFSFICVDIVGMCVGCGGLSSRCRYYVYMLVYLSLVDGFTCHSSIDFLQCVDSISGFLMVGRFVVYGVWCLGIGWYILVYCSICYSYPLSISLPVFVFPANPYLSLDLPGIINVFGYIVIIYVHSIPNICVEI